MVNNTVEGKKANYKLLQNQKNERLKEEADCRDLPRRIKGPTNRKQTFEKTGSVPNVPCQVIHYKQRTNHKKKKRSLINFKEK